MVKKTVLTHLMADENLAYEDLDFGFVVPAYKVDFIDKILINKEP
jgi:hypothetical protein